MLTVNLTYGLRSIQLQCAEKYSPQIWVRIIECEAEVHKFSKAQEPL